MAGSISSENDLVPKSRSATSPDSTMLGTSAGRMPATGMMPFKPAGIEREDFTRPGPMLEEKLSSGQLGHGADARDGVDFAGFGANQDRRFAAHA